VQSRPNFSVRRRCAPPDRFINKIFLIFTKIKNELIWAAKAAQITYPGGAFFSIFPHYNPLG
jgi:hypothetical protein